LDAGHRFQRDGRAVVTRNMVEKHLIVFRFEGGRLTDTGQRIALKGGPASIRTAK